MQNAKLFIKSKRFMLSFVIALVLVLILINFQAGPNQVSAVILPVTVHHLVVHPLVVHHPVVHHPVALVHELVHALAEIPCVGYIRIGKMSVTVHRGERLCKCHSCDSYDCYHDQQ